MISPRLRDRTGLCTVVPMSTTEPSKIQAYHYRLHTTPSLPAPYVSAVHWVKADMLYTVSFERLFLMSHGKKNATGKRIYDQRVIDAADLLKIQAAILQGIGLTTLTSYL